MVEHQQGYLSPAFPAADSSKATQITGNVHGDAPRCSGCFVTWAPSPQGNYDDAEPLYRRAKETTEATLGKNHPAYSTILSNLAGLLEKQVRVSGDVMLSVRTLLR